MSATTTYPTHRSFTSLRGAQALLSLLNNEPAPCHAITTLTLTFSTSSWTDHEDDIWSIALLAYRPYSTRLRHLKLHIQGPVLFTEHNYLKPALHTSVPPAPASKPATPSRKRKRKLADACALGSDDDDDDDDGPPPHPPDEQGVGGAKGRRMKPRGVERGDGLTVQLAANSDVRPDANYRYKKLPIDGGALPQVYPKAVVFALEALAPVRWVSIAGPMEVELRRKLVTRLVPDWESQNGGWNRMQLGLVESLSAEVYEADVREREGRSTGEGLRPLSGFSGPGGVSQASERQDEEDFGGRKGKGYGMVQGMQFGMPRGWVVPTGKAGRVMMGWDARKAWMGVRGDPEDLDEDESGDEEIVEEEIEKANGNEMMEEGS